MNVYNKINNHAFEWFRLLSAESQEDRKHHQYSKILKCPNFAHYDILKRKQLTCLLRAADYHQFSRRALDFYK